MKNRKSGNLSRVIVLILIATVLICAVGFAADGWQSSPTPESGNTDTSSGDTDENTDGDKTGNTSEEAPKEPVIYIPKYTDPLTGLEVSEEIARAKHLAFVTENTPYLYGMSSASMVLEFPLEAGETRYLIYQSNATALGKIGSLAKARRYITALADTLGGITVSVGQDDPKEISGAEHTGEALDLSRSDSFAYTENTVYRYTNGDLITSALSAAGISPLRSEEVTLPFSFYAHGKEPVAPVGTRAETVLLPYAQSNETELYYDKETKSYAYSKCGSRKIDTLNGKSITFTNVFVLFADATTYEKADGTSTVLDTQSAGTGYYISHGVKQEITWRVTDGKMSFFNTEGEGLTVYRGSSYLSFFKSSMRRAVTLQ